MYNSFCLHLKASLIHSTGFFYGLKSKFICQKLKYIIYLPCKQIHYNMKQSSLSKKQIALSEALIKDNYKLKSKTASAIELVKGNTLIIIK